MHKSKVTCDSLLEKSANHNAMSVCHIEEHQKSCLLSIALMFFNCGRDSCLRLLIDSCYTISVKEESNGAAISPLVKSEVDARTPEKKREKKGFKFFGRL